MARPQVVCFGEIMARLNPPGYQRLVQANSFEVSFAGGEANVAVALASLGWPAAFISKLPAHAMGQAAVNALRRYGVNTDQIVRGGQRLGLYFVEKGASQRASTVLYDRAGSAVALAQPQEYKWTRIFEGAAWFHFTGITPALSAEAAAACLDAARTAKEMGLTVSCDINYRSKLWDKAAAGQTMAQLMPFVDLCIANESDLADVFGMPAEGAELEQGQLEPEAYVTVAKRAREAFGCRWVAITLRRSLSASDNTWGGLLYDGDPYFSKQYAIHLVDRVGGGDAFGGALIYALLQGDPPQQAIEFAAAASCLKQTIEQDFNLVSEQEVRQLMAGGGAGRIQR